MAETKQVKISKLFKHGKQIGFCLTIDGQMLSSQKQLTINTYPLDASVNVEFKWHESMVTDAPDIHLK